LIYYYNGRISETCSETVKEVGESDGGFTGRYFPNRKRDVIPQTLGWAGAV
jgi:hypothetical protein